MTITKIEEPVFEYKDKLYKSLYDAETQMVADNVRLFLTQSISWKNSDDLAKKMAEYREVLVHILTAPPLEDIPDATKRK